MNSTQKRVAISAALLAVTFLVSSVASAQGLSNRLRATIPFGFYAGENLMPAGDYEVQIIAAGVAKLTNRDAHTSVIFNTVRLSYSTRDVASGKLTFNKYGDDHFLAQMWWAGQREGMSPVPSKRESEMARLSTPVRITVAR